MDENYMRQALEWAEKGRGRTAPNPMVGAVIVKEGRIIGTGYHTAYGKAHAEVEAFRSIDAEVAGATLFVTLEPCSHHGKTPPCADLIIEKKIRRVVIASLDPNPLVSGRGVEKLKKAGIEVAIGVLKAESNELNEVFMKYIVHKKPFVVLKSAMSLDGKIATASGESKWITGEAARKQVHYLRNHLSGIMVGVETIIQDDPELTSRVPGGKNPVRIIVDSTLRLPLEAKVLRDQVRAKTIIATTEQADKTKWRLLQDRGITLLAVKALDGRVDLAALMLEVGRSGIDSILLEGGATLNYSALMAGVVDKVHLYIAPKLIGGERAKTPIGGNGIRHLDQAIEIERRTMTVVGEDLLIKGYIRKRNQKK